MMMIMPFFCAICFLRDRFAAVLFKGMCLWMRCDWLVAKKVEKCFFIS